MDRYNMTFIPFILERASWRFWSGRIRAWVCTGILGLAVGCGNRSNPRGIWGLAPAPDGKTVYFTACSNIQCSVLALDLASGTIRVVSEMKRYAGTPVCSPDGKWLLMTSGADASRGQIDRLDLTSGKVTPFLVSSFSDSVLSLNGDGKMMAFVRYVRKYTHGFGGTGWTDGDVWVGPMQSGSYRQVTHMKAIWIGPGAFLPDGHHLIVTINMGGKMEVYRLDLLEGTINQLTHGGDHNRDPTVTPDGSMIVFASDRQEKFHSELWRMRPDGADVKQITNLSRRCSKPRFLPDGRSVVFLIGQEIWRVDVDGTNLRKLYPVH